MDASFLCTNAAVEFRVCDSIMSDRTIQSWGSSAARRRSLRASVCLRGSTCHVCARGHHGARAAFKPGSVARSRGGGRGQHCGWGSQIALVALHWPRRATARRGGCPCHAVVLPCQTRCGNNGEECVHPWVCSATQASDGTSAALTYARRVLLLDTERNSVFYLKATAALPGKPFPTRALNVSAVAHAPKALDFLFATPWKGSTRLRLWFANVREREHFAHLYGNLEAISAAATTGHGADNGSTVSSPAPVSPRVRPSAIARQRRLSITPRSASPALYDPVPPPMTESAPAAAPQPVLIAPVPVEPAPPRSGGTLSSAPPETTSISIFVGTVRMRTRAHGSSQRAHMACSGI